jgi:hypothetical protein
MEGIGDEYCSTPETEFSKGAEADLLSQTSSLPSLAGSSLPESSFNFDDPDSDPMTLLNFFSLPSSNPSSAVNFITDINTETCPMYCNKSEGPPLDAELGSQPLIRELENIAQNDGFERAFDWFAWGQYDQTMG